MSFVTDNEEIIEEVADWAVEAIQEIVKALMPDGKPFFKDLRTEQEEFEEYLAVRDNPEAWAKWLAEQAGNIIAELQDSGVDPELIASVHPVNIAISYAVAWSAEMETKIQEGVHGLPTYSGEMAEAGREVLPTGVGG